MCFRPADLSSTRVCRECGEETDITEQFCSNCGAKLTASLAEMKAAAPAAPGMAPAAPGMAPKAPGSQPPGN